MKPINILLVCLIAILGLSTLAYAEVPKMINYQGKITTPQGALIDTTVSMTFSIYGDPLGMPPSLWGETQDSVKVEYGVFSVLLGSVNPIPDSVFDGNVRYLALKVGNDAVMMPLRPIVSVGYAYHAGTADTAHFAMPDADWTINGDDIYHINGNVGIGTVPLRKFHVKIGSSGDPYFIWDGAIFESNTNGWWAVYTPNNGVGGLMVADPEDFDEARLYYNHNDNSWRIDGNGTTERVRITSSGNVGIGTTSPAYKLDVNGDINVAGSYNVKKGGVNYNHPDYVFEPDYKLMSLEELKKYVFEHKSLPNVISAEVVKKNNGFKMDELLVQILEKIEEQTLYIFQLEERIAKLEEQVQK